MKKKLIKLITYPILTFGLALFFLASCSPDDKDPLVVINSVTPTKTAVFIDETITLTIDGSGYTDIAVTSGNSKVKITKAASNKYEITATESTVATIYVELKNKSNKDTKTVSLAFAEHGVKDFNTVEGIKVNVDLSTKLLSLLGEPETKSDSSTGTTETWRYYSKGLTFLVNKSNSVVNQIDIYSSYYFYTNSSNIQVNYTNYPYEIGNNWKINNSNTTMDLVIGKLETPSTQSSTASGSTLNVTYQYSTQRIVFRFYSDAADNYIGKKIIYFSVY